MLVVWCWRYPSFVDMDQKQRINPAANSEKRPQEAGQLISYPGSSRCGMESALAVVAAIGKARDHILEQRPLHGLGGAVEAGIHGRGADVPRHERHQIGQGQLRFAAWRLGERQIAATFW